MASDLNAAEYRVAEFTAPRSVEDIDTTLSNLSNQILFYKGRITGEADYSLGYKPESGHLRDLWFRVRHSQLYEKGDFMAML